MVFLKVLALSLFLSSCAKLNYLYEQGVGQMALLSKGVDNEKAIKNVRIPKENREKIKKIEELKKYFYNFWQKKETSIYSQTTILKTRAVSYLVIASPHNEIKAVETCFPFMGCFPYLGFFNYKSADEFSKSFTKEEFSTWIRPVYAYSTLGYLNDNILSSFFHYDEVELTELIFHELFHTIFFVKNEVELNENLANFFSEKMLQIYFKENGKEESLKQFQLESKKDQEIRKKIVFLSIKLNELYKSLMPSNMEDSKKILNEFLESTFTPEIEKVCLELYQSVKECGVLEKKWNNARFAAFLTYENKADDLSRLFVKTGSDVKEFYRYIAKKYDEYEKRDNIVDVGFSKFLFE